MPTAFVSASFADRESLAPVLDAIKRVPGAGQAQIMGLPDQAMRIWMNPDRMASLGITTTDIQQAVASQNALYGAGQIGQQPTSGPVQMTFPIVTQRPFTDPSQYENMILRASQDGSSIVRLKDVARAEVGLRQYIIDSKLNGTPATFIAIYQQPGANGMEVSKAVRKTLEEMKPRFPDGLEYRVSLDTNDFVRLSIEEVIHTLFEAILLVIFVVYLFLQSFRTTIICAVAIVVALVSTFTGMLALGFSINLLTLFGLVLAIGMVVDDAIVVVENVERNMARFHLSPKEATIKAMGEISGSLVAVVLVMASVFLPAAFLPGTTGQLYKQFAITIVISVAVSGFVALTLTPALCATLLKPLDEHHDKHKGFFGWFNRAFDWATERYSRVVGRVVKHTPSTMVAYLGVAAFTAFMFMRLPGAFLPGEDQGYCTSSIQLPSDATMERTAEAVKKYEDFTAGREVIENVLAIQGFGFMGAGPNIAMIFTNLKTWDKRRPDEGSVQEEVNAVRGAFADHKDGRLIAVVPPSISELGNSAGFAMRLLDRHNLGPEALQEATMKLLIAANQSDVVQNVYVEGIPPGPFVRLVIDRQAAEAQGVSFPSINATVSAALGSMYVSSLACGSVPSGPFSKATYSIASIQQLIASSQSCRAYANAAALSNRWSSAAAAIRRRTSASNRPAPAGASSKSNGPTVSL